MLLIMTDKSYLCVVQHFCLLYFWLGGDGVCDEDVQAGKCKKENKTSMPNLETRCKCLQSSFGNTVDSHVHAAEECKYAYTMCLLQHFKKTNIKNNPFVALSELLIKDITCSCIVNVFFLGMKQIKKSFSLCL